MRHSFFSFIFSCGLFLLFLNSAHAYTFSPPVVHLTTSGNSSSFLLTVTNPDDKVIPLDLTVYEVEKDLDGNPIEGEEVIDDFIIYPSQFLLKPREVKLVQFRWVGGSDISQERSFTLFARELPLPVEKTKENMQDGMSATINVLINYAVRVYVSPPGAVSDIVVDSVDIQDNGKEDKKLIIICLNKGTRNGKLIDAQLVVTSDISAESESADRPSVTLTRKEIPGFASAIFAKSRRRFVIPWPQELPFGPVQVILKNVQN